MNICVITECELARSHGTGAHVLQVFNGSRFHHLYWNMGHGQVSETANSTLLVDRLPQTPIRRWMVRQVRRLTGKWWWGNLGVIHGWRLHKLLRSLGIQFDVCYIMVAREWDARRMLSIVRELKVPYVVHMVDLLEEEGIQPDRMPRLAELLRGAAGLMSLLPSITVEMRKVVDEPIEEVPIGKPVTPWIARAPREGEKIRIVISGRPYAGGCRLLAEALEKDEELRQRVELRYVGLHYRDLPQTLRPFCRDAGFIESDEKFQQFLAEAHLAFLSGPDLADLHGRWSFPSRTVDYLMAGLPLVASVANGTATEDLLKPISPDAVAFARTSSDIAPAIRRLTVTPAAWDGASRVSRQFAEREMSIDRVRTRIFAMLERAVKMSPRG